MSKIAAMSLALACLACPLSPAWLGAGSDGNGVTTSPDGNPPADDRLVTMNFQDVEIAALAKFVSEITGRNFVADETVRGKVTVISPTRITPEAAYKVFQSALQVKGFTTVPNGAVTKIVPTRAASQSGLPTLFGAGGASVGDEFVTRLVPLRHIDAVEMASVLRPMVSPDGLAVPYAQTNHLILTDAASNLKRLLGVIEELDIEAPRRSVEVIALRHATARDLAPKLEKALEGQKSRPAGAPMAPAGQKPGEGPGGGLSQKLGVLADERTNSLIVTARAEEIRAARELVSKLDLPLPPEKSRINVYYLKNADAEQILPVLGEVLGVRTAAFEAGDPTRESHPSRLRAGRAGPGGGLPWGESRAMSAPSASAGAAGAQMERSLHPSPSTVSGLPPGFASDIRITADRPTNTLLISASPQDFETLKTVIEKLDVRRRQVYVEGLVLEVTVDRFRELGIEFQGEVDINGEGVGIGRVNLRDLNTALTNPASLSGLLLAAVSNRTVRIPDGAGGFVEVPAKIALLRAAQVSSDLDVLSAPTILTTDNEEAEILVGQNVPFIASRATDTSRLDNLFATVERHDVGIRLRLTPRISEGDLVRLDLYEEVSNIVPTTVGDPNLVGPTISIRSASTTVVVKDGQTVVVGGLISDNTSRRSDKVPYLGDIPVLGNLFQSKDRRMNKINLLIFLTPRIIRNEAEMLAVSQSEKDRFRGLVQAGEAPSPWRERLDKPSFAPPPAPRP